MKNKFLLMLVALSGLLTSCEVVGGIFKAGLWSGIILVFLVLCLIVYLVVKARNR